MLTLPQFHRLLEGARTIPDLLRAYYLFASGHGAHSDMAPETWHKVQAAMRGQSIESSQKTLDFDEKRNIDSQEANGVIVSTLK